MTAFIKKYRRIWGDKPFSLLEKYKYHPELTARLDNLDIDDFNRETLYEIVLWKVSRFPYLDDDLITDLKSVKGLKPRQHKEAGALLERLLCSPGIALPMASTILRFLNPSVFQIIDDRAYRQALPTERKYPAKPTKNITNNYLNRSKEIYFRYLDELHKIATKDLPFSQADRILYQLDIELENPIGGKM